MRRCYCLQLSPPARSRLPPHRSLADRPRLPHRSLANLLFGGTGDGTGGRGPRCSADRGARTVSGASPSGLGTCDTTVAVRRAVSASFARPLIVPRERGVLSFCVVSDTHGFGCADLQTSGDVLIHAGDFWLDGATGGPYPLGFSLPDPIFVRESRPVRISIND